VLPNNFKFFTKLKILYFDVPGDRCGGWGGAEGNGRGAIGCIEGDGGGGGGKGGAEGNDGGAPGGIVGPGGAVGKDGKDGRTGGFNSDRLIGRIGRGVMVGRASSLMLIDIFCFCESRSV